VYEDAARDFAELERGIGGLIGDGPTPVNTTCFPRREVVDGAVYEAAPFAVARRVEAEDEGDEVRADGLTLENAHLRVELAENGSVASVVHKASGRETLAWPGNRLELYDDNPNDFDAWDIDPYTLRTRRDAAPADACEVVTATPLRAEVAFERRLGEASRLRQIVRLDAGARRVEFHTTIDWHESHTLLRVCFPLAVRAVNATYEMPFGYAERPTHYSTSFDRARYEVPGQRWADLSEHGFGAAVLTDSKYGYSCYGQMLRVSLLRSPTSPDPEADRGRHEFAYALFPHAGGWRDGGVVAEAIRFNAPLRRTDFVAESDDLSFASVDDANVVLDTVKRAEDSDALVLRLYDAHGARGTARLRLGAPFASARRANALEDDAEELAVEDGAIVVPYRPHEIVTVKVS
jgi:alpha-mannosidase